MDGFLSWWDGVELWLSGLGFVLQTLVVMPVVLALAYGLALLLDAFWATPFECGTGSRQPSAAVSRLRTDWRAEIPCDVGFGGTSGACHRDVAADQVSCDKPSISDR